MEKHASIEQFQHIQADDQSTDSWAVVSEVHLYYIPYMFRTFIAIY